MWDASRCGSGFLQSLPLSRNYIGSTPCTVVTHGLLPREETLLISATQNEVHSDLRLHLDGFSVEDVRFVAPLAHGAEGRRYQHGVSGDRPQIFNCAVF